MRCHRYLLFCALLSACLPPAPGTMPAPASKHSYSEDRAGLLTTIEQFNSSIRDGDKERYGGLFVEDFLFTWSRNGQLYDRAAILPNVVPTPTHNPLIDELQVRIYGDAGVVNFRSRADDQEPGARVTFSCARIDGEWKVMASHSTLIVPEEDPPQE